jgi:hypothetical protein
MTTIRKLRRLNRNESGVTAGISLSRDVLRLEGIMTEDGELVERPDFVIDYQGDGEWKVELLEKSEYSDNLSQR